ncbi:uncharacterized protein LOC125168133 [Prionailurus viverrinus]|uniref:uncharacterized protein LOC125168133 n=1 Tax=Prionailurus viverrinus TaxID=61388 RepID=UPI001FF12104|nr:uncharacterized protein LOC125168133 [Prionailurus viverrinus]
MQKWIYTGLLEAEDGERRCPACFYTFALEKPGGKERAPARKAANLSQGRMRTTRLPPEEGGSFGWTRLVAGAGAHDKELKKESAGGVGQIAQLQAVCTNRMARGPKSHSSQMRVRKGKRSPQPLLPGRAVTRRGRVGTADQGGRWLEMRADGRPSRFLPRPPRGPRLWAPTPPRGRPEDLTLAQTPFPATPSPSLTYRGRGGPRRPCCRGQGAARGAGRPGSREASVVPAVNNPLQWDRSPRRPLPREPGATARGSNARREGGHSRYILKGFKTVHGESSFGEKITYMN